MGDFLGYNTVMDIIHVFIFISLYFEIFMLVTFLENRKILAGEEGELEENGDESREYPSATVIVPCFNEGKTIVKTVESLLNLDYPKNKLKIFIIDDGSTDNTLGVVEQFRGNEMIKIFHKENGGKYTAMNYGLEHLETELIGCLDADSFVDNSALKRLVRKFDDPEVMAVTPAIKIHNPKNILELIQNIEYKVSIFIRKMFGLLDALNVAPGPLSIFRKKVFDDLGPYKSGYNTEDMEIAFRMQSNNYKIVNCHNAFVYTVPPRSIKTLHTQRVRWTYGFLKNAIDYRFLFFKKKYGNLGIFTLPIAVFSIFFGLYFMGTLIAEVFGYFSDQIIKISAIGFNFSWPSLKPDLFFFDTGQSTFLILLMFLAAFLFIVIGKKLSDGKFSFSFDMLYYLFLYGLLAPWWLLSSVYNIIFTVKPSWR
jgi:cellulose synthase/poly-beta-1,6-N-acetylglucosamine synthase-like glycosyltransferase